MASHPPFIPPGPNDLRSPCPALNALANHGLLPHDGRDITPEMISNTFKEVFNIDPSFSARQAKNGLSTTPDPNTAKSFSLDQINAHNIIEHDGSLTRADLDLGADSKTFHAGIWGRVKEDLGEGGVISLKRAAKARALRIQRAKSENPKMVYGLSQWQLSVGQTGLYLATMGDVSDGTAPLKYVRVLFGKSARVYILVSHTFLWLAD